MQLAQFSGARSIGHAIGATAYFKRVKIRDYYNSILSEFKSTGSNWSNQAKVVSLFYDIGHFKYCPKDLIRDFLKFLVLWYIGEPGGYGTWGRNRVVFYSDAAAPIIKGVIKNADINLSNEIEKLRKDRDIEGFITNKYILSRFENLLDVADKVETES